MIECKNVDFKMCVQLFVSEWNGPYCTTHGCIVFEWIVRIDAQISTLKLA